MNEATGFKAYLLKTTAANWIASGLSILYALVITPIVVRAIHAELYGVWSFLNGVLAYSNLLYLGLGAAFVRYLSEYRAAGDRERVNRLTSIVFGIYTVLGLLCIGLCALLSPFVPRLFAGTLTLDASSQAVMACVLLGGRLFFMFVATVFSGLLNAEERLPVVSKVSIVVTLGRFAAVPLLLSSGPPLVVLAAIMTVSAGIEAIVLAVAAATLVSEFRPRLAVPRVTELRLLYGFGLKSFFVLMAGWIINYTDTTVIGIKAGATAVAIYSIALQLASYGRVLIAGIVSALLARLTAYEAVGNRAAIRDTYVSGTRGISCVAAFIAVNLVTLGPAFTSLWVGDKFAASGRTALIALALAGYAQALSTQMTIPFYQALHKLRVPVIVLLAEALANLALSLWSINRFGIGGVAVSTLIPTLVISLAVLPAHLSGLLAVPRRTLFRSAVVPSVILFAAGLAGSLAAQFLLPIASLPALLTHIIINMGLAAAVAAIVLPAHDLSFVGGTLPISRWFGRAGTP